MHRPAIVAILISTTLVAGAALAQSTDTTPASTSASTAGKFVTAQGNSEFRASKFVGLDVYGSENEKIGDISEVLLDGQGQARSVVIGVGGFLGIGQKNVAVPWSALTWSNEPPVPRAAAADRPAVSAGAGGVAGGNAGSSAMSGAPRPPAATPARSPAEQAAYNGYPDHAKAQLTKVELNDAPAFKYVSETASTTGGK